ncbi:MAG: TolC family protein, partial [Planctomycetes bacterium]|nr:TolC family protein [Planctomycetota bacterium]
MPLPARSRRDLILVSMPLALAIGGCASYEAAPIDLDRLPSTHAQRRLDEPALAAFAGAFLGHDPAAWPPAALDLPALQAIALFHRPERSAARARLAQAEAAHAIAGQWPNPRLAGGPGMVGNPGGAIRWLASIGLSFPLELFGQRGGRIEAAASEITAARIDTALAEQTIRADVVERAFAAVHQRQLAALARELVTLREQASTLAEARAAAGAGDARDVAAARAAARRATLASATADREAAAALAALAAAVGVPPAVLDTLPLQLPTAMLPDLDAATGERL